MISWLQTNFQRHFRTLFLVLLAVLIVSFVFTIGAAPGIGRGDERVQARTFFDLNLSSPEDQARLFGDASLSISLQLGYTGFGSEQVQEYALQRYAGIHLADQLHIPPPDKTELQEFILTLGAFRGPDGAFDAAAYNDFRAQLRAAGQYTEADVARVLGDDFRFNEMQRLFGGPGYYSDSEVALQLERIDTEWTVQVATIDYNSFNPAINPTADQLQAYFDANSFRYDTAPAIRVAYVEFPAARYLSEVTVTDAAVRAYYDANPARFPAPARAEEEAVPVIGDGSTDADFQAVRAQVEAALKLDRARRIAVDQASDLTVEIFDANLTSTGIPTFIAASSHTLIEATPFTREAMPAFLGSDPRNVAAAFTLSAERPLSDALPTPTGAVVLVWQESIPAAPSLYINVADQVRADYLAQQKRERFVELGASLRTALQTQLASGQSFADAAAAIAAGPGVTITTSEFANFTRRTPPADYPRTAIAPLEQLKQGDVSQMVIAGEEGVLVYAALRQLPATDASNPRFAEIGAQIAESNASTTASEIIRRMVEQELGPAQPAL